MPTGRWIDITVSDC